MCRSLPSTQKQEEHFFKAEEGQLSEEMWNAFFAEVSKVGRVLYAGTNTISLQD
jgi:hypothetical protein